MQKTQRIAPLLLKSLMKKEQVISATLVRGRSRWLGSLTLVYHAAQERNWTEDDEAKFDPKAYALVNLSFPNRETNTTSKSKL